MYNLLLECLPFKAQIILHFIRVEYNEFIGENIYKFFVNFIRHSYHQSSAIFDFSLSFESAILLTMSLLSMLVDIVSKDI